MKQNLSFSVTTGSIGVCVQPASILVTTGCASFEDAHDTFTQGYQQDPAWLRKQVAYFIV